ncbi:hypothetical protein KKE03_00510 [Patescibacteria group bacterium]|nr:hypothetical protein [Patescibacteria group bacterium]
MMLQLLHGPAISVSRKKLLEIKQKFDPNNVMVYEEGIDLQTILGGLSTGSLFPEQQLIVLENPPDFVFDFPLSPCPLSLVLWFDHEVDVKKWPGFEVGFFPEAREVSAFPFLDLLAEGNTKAFLEINKLKAGNFDVHYLIIMVFYLLRNLVATPSNAPDFVKRKLAKQRTRFDLEKIQRLYKDILEIDFKIKSGFLEKPQAEFLLIKKFIATGRS